MEDILDFEEDLLNDEDFLQEENVQEEIIEHGDYRLSSALRTVEDYEKNHVFSREKRKLFDVMQEDTIQSLSQIEIMIKMLGWCTIHHKASSGTLYHYVIREEIAELDLGEVFDISTHEYNVAAGHPLSRGRENYGKRALEKVYADYPSILTVMLSMLIIITMKNSIKSHRKNNGEFISMIPGMRLINDVIFTKLTDEIGVYTTSDCIGIWEDGIMRWTPSHYFINALDKLQERFNVFLYSSMCNLMNISGAPSYEKVRSIINILDTHLVEQGNKGYDAVAAYEATLVGTILTFDDQMLISDPYNFLRSLLKDLDDSSRKVMHLVIRELEGLTVEEISDLHGLYRIWGHPTIEIRAGLQKMRSVALKKKTIDNKLSLFTGRKFKEIFYYNYRNKNGFYPHHSLSENDRSMKSYLCKCLTDNIQFSPDCTFYNIEDWDLIESKKNFAIPHSWNMIHRAKDKAISPSRSEVFKDLMMKGHIFNHDNRRGVLKLIRTKLLPMREFIGEVAKDGMKRDDLIIGLYPKERENKIKPRFFSLMSFNIRLYMTATEELISDKILPMFPQITMCLNLLDMQKKMNNMTKTMGNSSRSVTYVINMDFAKWNQQMRYDICTSTFKEIDKLFGLPGMIDCTHKIFKGCVIWLSSGELPLVPHPDTGVYLDGEVAWTGDESGKEGVRQKGWTVMTVCDILYVASRFEAEVKLVGGGDNQVLSVTWTSRDLDSQGNISDGGKDKIRVKMREFTKALDDHFSRRGLPLKMSETWTSTSLFMYNKHMYHEGKPLRSVLKQVSRCFMFSNASIMTLSSVMNSLSTVIKAAAQKEYNLFPLIIMKNLWGKISSIFFLKHHPLCFSHLSSLPSETEITRNKKKRKIKIDMMRKQDYYFNCLYLPSILGGPGLINILGLMMRGFPDPLCESLAFLNKLKSQPQMKSHTKSLIKNIMSVSSGSERNFEKLIEDPQSINHDAPQTSVSVLRKLARKGLETLSQGQNNELLSVLNSLNESMQEKFYQDLSSGDVMAPRQLHEIAKASLYGYLNSMLSRVDQTKTVRRMNENMRVIEPIRKSEWKYIGYLLMRNSVPQDHEIEGCSREYAQSLRNKTWERKVVGVTVPHPVEYLKLMWESHPCDDDCIIVRKLNNVDPNTLTRTMGPCKPYLGSYTRERFRSTDLASAYGEEDILTRAIAIQKMIWWVYHPDSKMGKLVQLLFKAVTNTSPDGLWVDPETVKGSYDHRRKSDSNTHGGIPNFNSCMTSHFSLSTSSWKSHSKGGKNETIHFQSCIIRCLYECCSRIMSGEMMNNIIHFHESCPDCITLLDEYTDRDIEPRNSLTIPSIPGNRFVYLYKDDIEFDYHLCMKMIAADKLKLSTVELPESWRDSDMVPYVLSMMITLACMRQITGIQNSLFVISRNKGSIYKTVSLIKDLFWLTCHLGCDDLEIRTIKPLLMYCDCEEGRTALSSIFGITSSEDLEGDISAPQTGILMSSLRDCETPQIHQRKMIITSLGGIRTQLIFHRLSSDEIVFSCSLCKEALVKDYYNNDPVTLSSPISCEQHRGIRYTPPVKMNLHFENITKVRDMELVDVLVIDHENTNHNVKTILSTERTPVLSRDITVMQMAADCWGINYLEDMCLHAIKYDSSVKEITIFSDILSYEIMTHVRNRLHDPENLYINIWVDHLSNTPELSILEKMEEMKHSLGDVRVFMDTGPVMEEPLILITDNNKLSRLIYMTGRIRIVCMRNIIMELIQYGVVIHKLTFFEDEIGSRSLLAHVTINQNQSGLICPTMDNVLSGFDSSSAPDIDPSLLKYTSLSALKLRSSRYLFHNRLELIIKSQQLIKRISQSGRIKSMSKRNRGIQDELTNYLISILSHCEGGCEWAGRIRKIKYVANKGLIKVGWRDGFVSTTHERLYLCYCRQLREGYLEVNINDVKKGINLISPRLYGFNVIGR